MVKRTASKAKSKTGSQKRAPRPLPVRATAVLIPLAVWLAVIPYIAPSFGWGVDLGPDGAIIEFVDHVLPAIVIVLSVSAALALRHRPSRGLAFAAAGGLSLLAGLWSFSTHVPLVAQAADGGVSWGSALFHSSAGPVVMVAALIVLVPSLRAVD